MSNALLISFQLWRAAESVQDVKVFAVMQATNRELLEIRKRKKEKHYYGIEARKVVWQEIIVQPIE